MADPSTVPDAADPRPEAAGFARRYGVYAALAAGVVAVFLLGRRDAPAETEPTDPQPADVTAAGAAVRPGSLAPDTPVLGVSVGGQHRAYLAETMTFVRNHVVNDYLGGKPMTVTFCDKTRCARAFTIPGKTEPLNIGPGGYSEADGMMLRVGKHRYTQQSGRPVDADAPAFPLEQVQVEKTTWGEWLAAHPDTELWTGGKGGR